MKTVSVLEGARIPIGLGAGISRPDAERLRRFDEDHASSTGSTVFDWTRRGMVVARGYVGVVQIPGLAVEILPKTDEDGGTNGSQQNLLYMLHLSGWLKARERSFASLERQKMPLIDAFVLIFADGLLDALREGMDHAYVEREENLRVVRGRLVMNEHVRRNSVHRERLFVRYDDFSEDTKLNRLLKATCRLLLTKVRSFDVARRLREIALRFDGVSDVRPRGVDLDIELTRQNRRFETHLEFCRLVWRGESPSLTHGQQTSFSLLFSMHRLFEAFIATILRRHSSELGLPLVRVEAQSRGRHLLQDESGKNFVHLRPDVVGFRDKQTPEFVLDTKWKMLKPGTPIKSASVSDAYQLYAYARRYDVPLSVLLYPAVPGVEPQTLRFYGTHHLLRLGFVNLNRNLRREKRALLAELAQLLHA